MQRSLIICALTLVAVILCFAVSTEKTPLTMANDSSDPGEVWLDINDAKTDNGIEATVQINSDSFPDGSQFLKATNFAFAIPGGDTIEGIEVRIQRLEGDLDTEKCSDDAVKLVKGGVIGGDDKPQAGSWTTSEVEITYGSPTDKWGRTWIASDINATNFGVVISVIDSVGDGTDEDCLIDVFKITVHHTPGSKLLITKQSREVGVYVPTAACRVVFTTLYRGIEELEQRKGRRVWEAVRVGERSTFHKTRALARRACSEHQVAGVH